MASKITDPLTRNALQPQAPQTGDRTFELVKSLWDDVQRVNSRRFRAQREELAYSLRLQHYLYDTGNAKDQRLLQPHGPELYSHLRHKWSNICRVPTYIECRPQQEGTDDPEVAEDAELALKSVLENPMKMYHKLRRRWVMGALAARAWVMAFDCEPGIGPYGKEIIFRLVPDWHFGIAPGWQDHHDETCPWVTETATMRLGDVLRRGQVGPEESRWKNTDKIRPDGATMGTSTAGLPAPLGNSNQVSLTETGTPTQDISATETVTIVKWWCRDDGTTVEQPRDAYPLAPQDQYAECLLCGFQSRNVPREADGSVAKILGTCPSCEHAPLVAIRQNQIVDVFARFPTGRLVIIAPHCNVVLWDDAWPYKLRSFPYMRIRAYDHPEEPVGQSDTSLHWTSQSILNGIRRFGWEQMRRNVDVIIAPLDGLFNSKGLPFQHTDMHGGIAYYKDPIKARGLQHFQGSGLPAALPVFHQIMADQFRAHSGTADLGLTAQQSKDIPVGTVQQLTEQGDLPVQDHIQAIQEEESIGFGVLLDLIVQTWGDERPVRYLGPDGKYKIKRLKGALLTSMDVIVTASPSLSAIKSEEMTNFVQWAKLMQVDPAAGSIVAELSNIPPSFVRRYMERRQKLMEAQAPPIPGGGAVPPAVASRMGPNGNGAQAAGDMTGAMQ